MKISEAGWARIDGSISAAELEDLRSRMKPGMNFLTMDLLPRDSTRLMGGDSEFDSISGANPQKVVDCFFERGNHFPLGLGRARNAFFHLEQSPKATTAFRPIFQPALLLLRFSREISVAMRRPKTFVCGRGFQVDAEGQRTDRERKRDVASLIARLEVSKAEHKTMRHFTP
jgi:hypothetical protein